MIIKSLYWLLLAESSHTRTIDSMHLSVRFREKRTLGLQGVVNTRIPKHAT